MHTPIYGTAENIKFKLPYYTRVKLALKVLKGLALNLGLGNEL